MKPARDFGRCEAVALVGEAPQLATYLASLRAQQVPVVVEERLDDRTVAILRKLRSPVVILGDGIRGDTGTLVALCEIRAGRATFVTVRERFDELRTVASNHLLPWPDVAWFVPAIYRRFDATAEGRIHVARSMLQIAKGREWFAKALMTCPCKTKIAARKLGLSRAGLDRRMVQSGITWHALGDRLTLDVHTHLASSGDAKKRLVAEELNCSSTTELSRRLRRIELAQRSHDSG